MVALAGRMDFAFYDLGMQLIVFDYSSASKKIYEDFMVIPHDSLSTKRWNSATGVSFDTRGFKISSSGSFSVPSTQSDAATFQ
jgi:hypothetical protein